MKNVYDENQYELMPDEVLKIKDQILEVLTQQQTPNVIMALMSAMIEVMVTTGPSKQSAIDTVAQIALSMTASINACDEVGMCNWNDRLQ